MLVDVALFEQSVALLGHAVHALGVLDQAGVLLGVRRLLGRRPHRGAGRDPDGARAGRRPRAAPPARPPPVPRRSPARRPRSGARLPRTPPRRPGNGRSPGSPQPTAGRWRRSPPPPGSACFRRWSARS
jgi:hypothetical protein